MVTSAILFGLLLGQKHGARNMPKWFDFLVAGYAFAYDQKHSVIGVSDPNTGYMLIRTVECDGADMTLLLTRDRYEVSSLGFAVPNFKPAKEADNPMVVKRLPSLSTGKGIVIGSSPDTLFAKLGKPSETNDSGNRNQFRSYTYDFQVGHGEESTLYQETYTYKANKLIEINFNWGPGDGYVDYAIVGPKVRKLKMDKYRK